MGERNSTQRRLIAATGPRRRTLIKAAGYNANSFKVKDIDTFIDNGGGDNGGGDSVAIDNVMNGDNDYVKNMITGAAQMDCATADVPMAQQGAATRTGKQMFRSLLERGQAGENSNSLVDRKDELKRRRAIPRVDAIPPARESGQVVPKEDAMEIKNATGESIEYRTVQTADDEMPGNVRPLKRRPQVKRVSFLVSDNVLRDLRELTGPDETMTDIFKKALACLKYLETNREQGKRLFVGKSHDRIESEVVLLR